MQNRNICTTLRRRHTALYAFELRTSKGDEDRNDEKYLLPTRFSENIATLNARALPILTRLLSASVVSGNVLQMPTHRIEERNLRKSLRET